MTLLQWLANGGAYGLLATLWVVAAISYVMLAGKLGRRFDAPNDGCLLGFALQVLLITFGGLGIAMGLRYLPFPWFLLTGAAGAVLVPALACLVFNRRMRRWRPR